MTHVNACERYLNAIQELVDGTLGPIRRAELELHLESCDACRALAEDLQAIATAAQSLEPRIPPDRVWQQVAGRLRAEGRVSGTGPTAVRRHGVAILALAAALVLVVGSSLYFLKRQTPAAPITAPPVASAPAAATPQPASGNPAAATPVQADDMATDLAAIDKHFQNLIEQASTKDPATAAVLQKNLLVMNEAIAESRKALEADPQNRSAQLYENLKRKIRFLQDTIALMNSMRQGDAAGAAEIVESGKS
jgi:anti-sigma factor RsiW